MQEPRVMKVQTLTNTATMVDRNAMDQAGILNAIRDTGQTKFSGFDVD